jgi:hypothetical protein
MYDEQFLKIPCSSVSLAEYKRTQCLVGTLGWAIKSRNEENARLKKRLQIFEPKTRIEILPESRILATTIAIPEHTLKHAIVPGHVIKYACKKAEGDLLQALFQMRAKP